MTDCQVEIESLKDQLFEAREEIERLKRLTQEVRA